MDGVPQGSVLGPILFILYTMPLSDIIANHRVNHQLFADDTQLQKSAPLSEVTNLTKELNACTDDIKTWMTENQLELNGNKTEALLFPFSSSLKPSTVSLPDLITLGSHNIPFSDSARNFGFILDSKLSMKEHIIEKSAKLLILSLNTLVQSAGFTLKMQPRLVTSYILSQLVSSWVHLILSYNLSRKYRTLLQDLFSWHPITTTQHLSWKNCTGFPFQNILSIKSLVCVSVLTSLNCCMSTLRLIHYTLLLTPACWKSNNTNPRFMAFSPSLALDPMFGIHSHKTLDTAQPCHLLKSN